MTKGWNRALPQAELMEAINKVIGVIAPGWTISTEETVVIAHNGDVEVVVTLNLR